MTFKTLFSFATSVALCGLVACSGGGGSGSGGSGTDTGPGGNGTGQSSAREMVLHWNHVSVDASGLDHTSSGAHEQLGPTRSSRAMAIVHIAVFDAITAIEGRYEPYLPTAPAPAGADVEAAIAQAAHDTLVALFPSQTAAFDQQLASDLAKIPDGQAKLDGIAVGQGTAAAILADRANDGASTNTGPYQFGQEPGDWRKDPLNPNQTPLGADWKYVRPFVIQSADQFRIPPPPALDSLEYASAYDEVQRLGGDGVVTPTERTEDQTQTGLFWAYDGTPSLCAPPRLYNQITTQLCQQQGLDMVDTARALALTNVAMADAGISSWESKFHYNFWRPVQGIRESDAGTGPTGKGDGNPDTVGDPNFTPLGAPASNLSGPNFTPPFPSYPSGHATFGGALFETLRNVFGTDNVAFTFVSDELNGTTRDHNGNVRPLAPRSFSSLSQAEEENGQSRIYLGIHWAFDKTQGIAQGEHVADYVFERAFRPK
ncbi:MAG: phosphatase PAP2 family protein [Bdellovibrionota bacterium]